MKKLSFILLTCIVQLGFAQAMRFVYQARTTPDSTNLGSVKTELTYLDLTPQKSVFYSENRLKRDSLVDKMRQTQSFDSSKMQDIRSNINYIIEKDIPNQTVIFKSRIGRDQYTYSETQPMTWKILLDKVKIGEYNTQKAETQYGGRIWYVWFTTDLPYQDGPYKFSGLPGLIVKAEDKEGDYSFDLMQSKKIPEIHVFQQRGQSITVKKSDYQNLEKKFKMDPAGYMSAGNNGGGMGFGGGRGPEGGGMGGNRGGIGGGRGGFQMDENQRKQMQERMVNEIKSNNNPIELK